MIINKTKNSVVRDYLKGKLSMRELAEKYGVSKSAISNWVQEYETENPEREDEVENIKWNNIEAGCIKGGKANLEVSSKDCHKISFGGAKIAKLFGGRHTDCSDVDCHKMSFEGAKIAKLFGGRYATKAEIKRAFALMNEENQ